MTTTTRAGLFGGEKAIPLLGVDVRAEVVAGHARAVVRQKYRNDESKPIEAIYTFPLPSRAVLTGFAMSVAGRRLEGEVHEREEAFKRYDDAITAGHGGALLEQERPNVFTANVGNLLPGEETIVEIEYVEPVRADEGAIRWSVPTLVAPRYVPGAPRGDRTAHGTADPTDRVPDADRVSPPIADVRYGLSLEVLFDLGQEVDVESPSHRVAIAKLGGKTRVTLAQDAVPLDRDVVLNAFAASESAPLASVVAHRREGVGTFALTVVPDLAGAWKKQSARTDVVFVIDRSGSMGGSSIEEARTALRLCLRQLREGDRFAILAFDDRVETFSPGLVPFSPSTLARADAWIEQVEARGGTEMLAPLVAAADLAPGGVVILLTDGQVANEDEIRLAFTARTARPRVHSFGIGTNVSDALLLALADETGGAVESIHPGERVDEKVVAQFARATAPRVTELRVAFRGVDVGELAPAEPVALVDGEPLAIFGTFEAAGRGVVELRGMLGGEAWYLEVPFDLPEREDRAAVAKLWAQARIRDLERAALSGRRADAMHDRIVKLAKEHGVSSRYTSFVVVEKRTGDRRATGLPETRVVPVSRPAGWAMPVIQNQTRSGSIGGAALRRMSVGSSPARMPYPAAGVPMVGRPAPPPAAPRAMASFSMSEDDDATDRSVVVASRMPSDFEEAPKAKKTLDPILELLERQAASGLWEQAGRPTLACSVDAMLVLLRAGVGADHAVHGAQVKKAIDALVDEALRVADPKSVNDVVLALALAWLLASGRRTRRAIEDAARGRADLPATSFSDEPTVRARVDVLAAAR
ncbi:MAG TPA: VIT domain-containing protein [Labilithrix sp.]|jgi:Ca-activated chloride channel family protein